MKIKSYVKHIRINIIQCQDLTDIVRQNNIIFTHNSINNNTPRIFNDYFNFEESNHQYQTVNSLNSTYSIPAGSLELPTYRTNSGKSSIKYICASTWNSTLKDLSIKYTERYHKDPLWISKTNVQSLRNILKKRFLEYYQLSSSYSSIKQYFKKEKKSIDSLLLHH